MNSIEKLLDILDTFLDTLRKDNDDLAGSGYTVSVFVHHDCENDYVSFGNPAEMLEGLLYSLSRIKKACLEQMTEEEYKSIYNAALVAAMLRLAANNKEKKENADT